MFTVYLIFSGSRTETNVNSRPRAAHLPLTPFATSNAAAAEHAPLLIFYFYFYVLITIERHAGYFGVTEVGENEKKNH